MSFELVLASHNAGKVEEFRAMIAATLSGVSVRAYDGPEPVEDGVTFAENALIKARAAAAHAGLVALADDSGICVDVLGGAPGIFSARWSGRTHDAAASTELLLAQLADVKPEHRGAHFACVLALVVPDSVLPGGHEVVVEGRWQGAIASTPSGSEGHGYDPIFVPEGFHRSAAELMPEEKNAHSHRAHAFAALRAELTAVRERLR
ncbi:non-canonical purine NTP pyrophosphatase [Rathayibacter toxicus]|uniref:dITP/XTP pyrophosphatase n=1 Tax=Rathayibacter toxicus TaxID=145458 RepID=A0A0C5BE85_9MICO|nr:non-canonical purine NTP pyrophosphatase [Rathayibacter toxicus]AJM77339.1 NTP phosphatase [Rathayibacter toxicus]ALS56777.1 non-canonical purine NTP pyrophosphatase [Rathayibacter toxicus]KKM46376.1 NTP phosphatase [Rathayibacter toxicus]PPG23362.1 non-canonical purine NTP pyrophosphatase [Rathayibacter toxicus]PPG47946.1 non-canonical purine NTP pyrophosphatase [Rathayibacter toxicus]